MAPHLPPLRSEDKTAALQRDTLARTVATTRAATGANHRMPDNSPETIYAAREQAQAERARVLDRWSLWLGIGRVAVVVVGLVVALVGGMTLSRTLGALAIFGALTVAQDVVVRRRDWHARLARINARERAALRGDAAFGAAFEAPPDSEHSYADDLEIFSDHGLFRLVNRAMTTLGRRRLAGWLATPAEPEEIRRRQEAARELVPQLDHRQTLAAQGLPAEADPRQARAVRLLETPSAGVKEIPLPQLVLFGLPAITLGTGVAAWFEPATRTALMLLVTLQIVLYALLARRVARLLRETAGCAAVLKAYAAALETIETFPAECARLRAIQAGLQTDGVSASTAVRRLATILEWMEVRNSPMLNGLLNLLLLWDINGAQRLSVWLRRYRSRLAPWLEAVGEWEALSSLAGVAFDHPDWVWPQMLTEGQGVHARSLGHPLIPEDERVAADVSLASPGSIWIVTGPNMAGKSTFLRTVGVGLVMAHAGAPVCARECAVAPLRLITSMRISDSLDKKLSLFYAELQRLKQILDAVDRGEPVFFLIDEMLKGTNTLDRQAGALALVRQLHRSGASGIVATHDLGLARLADEAPAAISNFHFDGTVEGDRLVFDYRLRPGPCERFNALSLMRAIGIHVDEQVRSSLQDPA